MPLTKKKGNIVLALLMLTPCARWEWVVSTMPWPLYTMDRDPVSIVEEAR
jgi:hypothetical protein